MCNFLSAIVTPKGDILWHPMVDSHNQLIRLFKLTDKVGAFAKLELTPSDYNSDDLYDVSKWKFSVDEPTSPEWLEEIVNSTENKLRNIAKSLIYVDKNIDLIVDGCYIVGGKTTVEEMRGGRVLSVRGSATINYVCDSATIKDVRGSATINYVCDSATINYVRDSATINCVRGSATIKDVCDSATIKDVAGSATINYVCDSATINYVRDLATINYVCGSATINYVCDSAKLVIDRRIK